MDDDNRTGFDFWEYCLDAYYLMYWVDDYTCVSGAYYVGGIH